jgi:hypothetical protein
MTERLEMVCSECERLRADLAHMLKREDIGKSQFKRLQSVRAAVVAWRDARAAVFAALEEKGTAIDHLAALGMAESNLYRLAKGIE